MDSVPPAGSKTLCFQAKSDSDAILHVEFPVEVAGAEYNLVIVAKRVADAPIPDAPSTFVLSAEVQREVDARWFAEITEVPGAFSYGQTRDEAIKRATALALRVLADRTEGVEESRVDSVNAEGAG